MPGAGQNARFGRNRGRFGLLLLVNEVVCLANTGKGLLFNTLDLLEKGLVALVSVLGVGDSRALDNQILEHTVALSSGLVPATKTLDSTLWQGVQRSKSPPSWAHCRFRAS